MRLSKHKPTSPEEKAHNAPSTLAPNVRCLRSVSGLKVSGATWTATFLPQRGSHLEKMPPNFWEVSHFKKFSRLSQSQRQLSRLRKKREKSASHLPLLRKRKQISRTCLTLSQSTIFRFKNIKIRRCKFSPIQKILTWLFTRSFSRKFWIVLFTAELVLRTYLKF